MKESETFGKRFAKEITQVSQDAMDLLTDYPWPGNVRQLKHAIEYASINCKGRIIEARHLPEAIRQKSQVLADKIMKTENPLQEIEKEVIIDTLRRNKSNRGKTAKALKISRATLWRKMQKYNIK